jgi:hypothetical protein
LRQGDLVTGWRMMTLTHPSAFSPTCGSGSRPRPASAPRVIWEHADNGEDEAEIAQAFDLSLSDVRWALSFEAARRAA